MAKTAREIMTPDPVCVRSSDSVLVAARRMAELGVGSLPICGEDNKLKGLITDRDIVVKVIAAAKDGADDSAVEMLLPVIDGQQVIGIVALADVVRALSDPPMGALVNAPPVDR